MLPVITSRIGLVWQKAADALQGAIGWGLELIHAPARLKQFEFVDPETNETVYVYTDKLYSVLCVGQRRLYFDRLTGTYDGTSVSTNCVAGRVKLSD
jgi:hypothetical protein